MDEYVSREAIKAAVSKRLNNSLIIGWLVSIINAIPAADVAPVVHSEWKYFRKQGKAVCMNCSFERGVDDNFGKAVACPNCGAHMRDGTTHG